MIKKYTAVLKINWIQALEYRANAVVGVIAILSGLLIYRFLRKRRFIHSKRLS